MNPQFVTKLETMADKLQPKIDDCLRDRDTHTAKKLCQAMGKRLDGIRLKRAQEMLRALAECYRNDTVPVPLQGNMTAALAQSLTKGNSRPCQNGYHTYHVDCDEPHSDHPAVVAAWALLNPKTPEQIRQEKIAEVERSLHGNSIPGFFPTPVAVIQKMCEPCNFFQDSDDTTIMDPNGGSGAILDYFRSKLRKAKFITGEVNHTLRTLLELKGYTLSWYDFLTVEPHDDFKVDYVFMNPPFENLQDTEHVMHAYRFLKPGGELVAVVSPSVFYHSSKKAQKFREWFASVNGDKVAELPAGSFKESGTNVSTVIIQVTR